MSFIEGIGDDLIYLLSFLLFICLISFAWISTHVNHIPLSTTLFIIERRTHRRNEEESERVSPHSSPNLNEQTSSVNETLTEHESDNESSEIDEFLSEQISITNETNLSQIHQLQMNNVNSNETISQTTSVEDEDQSLRITIKFLNETQKSISANANDTISKVKRLYFADELSNNKIVRFIYQGRELQDSETLRTYNIRNETVIHCQISTRRHSTPNRINDRRSPTHINSDGFDTSSFLDASPINISSHIILFLTLILGSIWYLRIKYRVLFTPISTIILILITMIFIIFAFGPLLTARRRLSDIAISAQNQHIHRD